MGETQAESLETPEEARCLVWSARVQRLDTTEELLGLLRAVVPDPSALEETPPYFFRAVASNTRRDSFGTRMHRTTLENYAREAEDGRAFLDAHRTFDPPLGYSLRAQYIAQGGDGVGRTEADYYIVPDVAGVPGRKLQAIHDIRTATRRDVSVGFYLDPEDGGHYRCALCNRELFSGDCYHVPGLKYRVGKEAPEERFAWAWVMNGHLSETSSVYDGSTPGAMIVKAQREIAAGRVTPEEAHALEAQYRVRLPGAYHVWGFAGRQAAAAPESGTARRTQEERTMTLSPEQWETVGTALALAGLRAAEGQTPEAALRELVAARTGLAVAQARLATAEEQAATLETRVAELTAETQRLAPLADDGTKYRAALIEETLAEGVRAFENFAAETNKAMLEAAPLETVRQFRAAWKAIGDAKFPGGPHAQAAAPNGTERAAAGTPAAAFRVP